MLYLFSIRCFPWLNSGDIYILLPDIFTKRSQEFNNVKDIDSYKQESYTIQYNAVKTRGMEKGLPKL